MSRRVKLGDNAALTKVAKYGAEVLRSNSKTDFLSKLNLDYEAEKAFFDPVDGLPVAVFKIKTSEVATDHNGNIHPGALCVIFDHLSTYCVFADPNWWVLPDGNADTIEVSPHISNRFGLELGLSRNIKLHSQTPVKAGSTIRFVTKILENTPKSTYFFSQIFSEEGKLLATGHHDKVKLTKVVKPKL